MFQATQSATPITAAPSTAPFTALFTDSSATPVSTNDVEGLSSRFYKEKLPPLIYRVSQVDNRKGSSKYWVCGKINEANRNISFFIDLGADISIIPKHFLPNVPIIPLERRMMVTGFRDVDAVEVEGRVELSISFRPGVLKASFYVLSCPHPILGLDLLKDVETYGLSLITGRNSF